MNEVQIHRFRNVTVLTVASGDTTAQIRLDAETAGRIASELNACAWDTIARDFHSSRYHAIVITPKKKEVERETQG